MHAIVLVSVLYGTQILAPGFTATVLGPTLPGTQTTSTSGAVDPTTGDLWLSNGQTLFRLDGEGGVAHTESLLGVDGGPIGTSLSTVFVIGPDGTQYVNAFNPGTIYKRPPAGSWTPVATVHWPRDMDLDPDGNLIVLGDNGVGYDPGTVWSVSPLGVVTVLGVSQGESFVFDPFSSDILVPHYLGTGIDRFAMNGTLTTEFSWARDNVALYESIAITNLGNIILGVHKNDDDEQEYDEIVRVDGVTGDRFLIGTDVGEAVPVDMHIHSGGLFIAGFGSVVGLGVEGDFDFTETASIIPEPSTGLLLLLGLAAAWRRRRLNRSR